MNKEKIFFIHIPKSAGTSLIRIFASNIYFNKFFAVYPTRNTHPKEFLENYPEMLKSISVRRLRRLKIIGGHFNYGVHHHLNATSNYITILRNPVDRVISEYYYMKQKGFYHQSLIFNETLSLKNYLYHQETYYLNNLQTRLISGMPYRKGKEEVDDEMYKAALNNLKKFLAVGITERFVESLALFAINLGWKRIPVNIKKNVNYDKLFIDVDGETLDEIRKREKHDIKLYDEGIRLFENQLKNNEAEVRGLIQKINHMGRDYRFKLKLLNIAARLKKKLDLL